MYASESSMFSNGASKLHGCLFNEQAFFGDDIIDSSMIRKGNKISEEMLSKTSEEHAFSSISFENENIAKIAASDSENAAFKEVMDKILKTITGIRNQNTMIWMFSEDVLSSQPPKEDKLQHAYFAFLQKLLKKTRNQDLIRTFCSGLQQAIRQYGDESTF